MDSGAVYVFRMIDGAWQQEAYLKASNSGKHDRFGENIALSGSTLAIGAFGEDSAVGGVNKGGGDNSAPNSGAVYIFERGPNGWAQQAYIKCNAPGANDEFGRELALEGNTLVVSAADERDTGKGVNPPDDHDPATAQGSGAVYVFERTGTTWAQMAYIKASNADPSDYFGTSIALYGDTLAVGADRERSGATAIFTDTQTPALQDNTRDGGAVYLFQREGGTWKQVARYAHRPSRARASLNVGGGSRPQKRAAPRASTLTARGAGAQP